MMDWFLLLLMGFTTTIYTIDSRHTRKQLQSVRAQLAGVEAAIRTRQNVVAQQQARQRNPEVVRPRTVIRDSSDLPTTGRQSTGLKRSYSNGQEKRNGVDYDDQFSEHGSGHTPAPLGQDSGQVAGAAPTSDS